MVKFLIMVFCIGLMSQTALNAETFRARIVKTQGDVYVLDSQGEKRQPDRKKNLVTSNETIVTEKSSKAVVQFEDGAMSVLDEDSSLLVESSGWLSQLSGKIYYIFRKVLARDRNKRIKTRNATIGVRGTTFIVDLNDNNEQIALQEGRLNIESPNEKYEITRLQSMRDEFSSFKQKAIEQQALMQQEFEDYKTKINREFVEYRQSFDMQENQVVEINGSKLTEKRLDKEWQSQFEAFSEFTGEYEKAYK